MKIEVITHKLSFHLLFTFHLSYKIVLRARTLKNGKNYIEMSLSYLRVTFCILMLTIFFTFTSQCESSSFFFFIFELVEALSIGASFNSGVCQVMKPSLSVLKSRSNRCYRENDWLNWTSGNWTGSSLFVTDLNRLKLLCYYLNRFKLRYKQLNRFKLVELQYWPVHTKL